ncbi:MarR family winged helix-turn-helix transcriptional regulator [Streptomyces sp. NP160]|uniref:MarR family winged helix-turn-helix transcriptional regulator n=1 Tax=Streptomyces sp. NP160 TaxID=2586637 RepID=UPI001C5A466A|nr:MarR family winged helix-turn-helix transcriptional regulator [Streptomyces sp. NP160]
MDGDPCGEDACSDASATSPAAGRRRTPSSTVTAPAAPAGGWLTEEQQEAWKAVVGLASLLPGPLDAQLQRDSGLSLFEYMVLSSLSMQPGRSARMSSLARLASGSLSRLSNVVKKLEDRGLVRRSPDPADGRFTVAALTEAGWDVVVATAPGHVDAVRSHVLAPLEPEHLRALVEIAQRTGVMPGPGADC